ncbi:hypothetical protein ACLOJK_028878 [Asimina triloba]
MVRMTMDLPQICPRVEDGYASDIVLQYRHIRWLERAGYRTHSETGYSRNPRAEGADLQSSCGKPSAPSDVRSDVAATNVSPSWQQTDTPLPNAEKGLDLGRGARYEPSQPQSRNFQEDKAHSSGLFSSPALVSGWLRDVTGPQIKSHLVLCGQISPHRENADPPHPLLLHPLVRQLVRARHVSWPRTRVGLLVAGHVARRNSDRPHQLHFPMTIRTYDALGCV